MTEEEKKKLGGKIHKITNETLFRRLKPKEYIKLIRLIGKLFKAL